MREIKFRAFDRDQKKMITTFDGEYKIYVNEEDGNLFCGGFMPNGDWNEPLLMQFTGIKDKNGREIYEGDLIFSEYWNPNTWKVIFESGRFCFVALKQIEYPYANSIHYAEKFEIIGNIHDNPELLTDQ